MFPYSRLLASLPQTQLGFLRQISLQRLSSSTCELKLQESSTVSYLVSSCGLSPKEAIEVSEKIQVEHPERSDSVLGLLNESGFSKIQISNIVKSCPSVLLAKPEKTLMPKLEYLRSVGLSRTEISHVFSTNPFLFSRSLRNFIVPCYELLKDTLVEDKKVISVLRGLRMCSLSSITNDMILNMKLLGDVGVPKSCIVLMLTYYPDVAFTKHRRFVEALGLTKEIGLDPLKTVFVLAVQVFVKLRKSGWESKLKFFERWGWSRDETILAFKKQPLFLMFSEDNVTKTMNFLANEGWSSKEISRTPTVLFYSFGNRIVPRCSVIHILKLKGLVKNNLCLLSFLTYSEKKFLEKYVSRFQNDLPILLEVYEGKVDVQEVGA